MSFGFTEDQTAIRTAITEAYSYRNRQILFFAAAANEGANEKEMYPARDDHVFSIRATDHQGNWWSSKPPIDNDQGWSFMTLGQVLPSINHQESVTGTSYATPIAAGLAATVLAEARRLSQAPIPGLDRELVHRLSRIDGMRKILKELSVETARRCSYLNPLNFIRKSADERLAILRYAK
jgi:subtilisin family serine protease